jgi:uncharacterized protein
MLNGFFKLYRGKQIGGWGLIASDLFLLLIGAGAGFLFSQTGISIGWMLGSMMLIGALSITKPKCFHVMLGNGFNPFWKNAAQMLLAVQIGKQMTAQVWEIFAHSWLIMMGMLILSLILSILTGLFLNCYSHVGVVTSLYATAPGGLNNMPSIAEEVGANPVVVTVVQVMRILIVVGLIPVFVRMEDRGNAIHSSLGLEGSSISFLWWTVTLLIAAQMGYLVMKKLKFPAARMVGGIIGVAVLQTLFTSIASTEITPWYPAYLKIILQIILGVSLGVSVKKEMFKGMKKIAFLGFLSSFALMILMVLFSTILSDISTLPYLTTVLAFAPGGVAEMTITAMTMNENVPFVASAQTLRIIVTFLIVPPLCRYLSSNFTFKKDAVNNSDKQVPL